MDGGGGGYGNMVGGIAGSVLGNAEMVYGFHAARKNKKQLEEIEKNRPWYSRPGEEQQYLEMSKANAYATTLPGQKQYEQNIEQATQGNIRNIREMSQSPTSSLGTISESYRLEMGALNNLALQQAQYFQSNQDRLAAALRESAKYSDMEFEYNVNAPWQRQYQNKINEYESNRNVMKMGMSTWANAAANFGGSQGTSRPIQEPTARYNYGQMQQDITGGEGVDYIPEDVQRYRGTV